MPLLAPPDTLTAVQLARALRTRELSAREALADHLARIEAVNDEVNAVVTLVADQAKDAADQADRRAMSSAKTGEPLPPLHGIPMTHKDTHATRGIRTTSGSPLADLVPLHDEVIVARLKAAGVVSTGKNNVPEFAAGSHTFNELFGATRNPHDLTRSAGGSSGGAAAALATGIQALADGSDMGGSLRNPASFCGVVGLRPSHGLIPMGPNLDPHAWLSVTGPMARTVDDVALMMSASTEPSVAAAFADVLDARAVDSLEGLRIGVSVDLGLGLPVEAGPAEAVRRVASVLTELGAHVEDASPRLTEADLVFDTTRAFAMALALRGVVDGHREDGLVKPEVLWNVDRGLALSGPDLMDAAVARGRLDAAVRRWFGRFDLLLTVTSQVLPFAVEERYPTSIAGVEMGSYVEWMRSCSVISATGCPALSLPAGFATSDRFDARPAEHSPQHSPQRPGEHPPLPVGVQLVTPIGSDARLLRIARTLEAALTP
ncbi:amidase [Ornithinimicrobium sp. Y1694]|uniref:amidase n=1 Tax=Ornithinimicrobium sp. Y1694 TaxID=3418590 RepID=UPI003CEDA7CD